MARDRRGGIGCVFSDTRAITVSEASKKTLLLIGGGHAHVELLRQLAIEPAPQHDIALFDPAPSVWFSAMLPGVIAGHYEPSAAKINLWALCQRARVRFIQASITEVIADLQRVKVSNGESHFYDYLSLDIGSVSRPIPATPGAYVVPVKPTDSLLGAITEREAIRSTSLKLSVVGGGASAVEVALALAYRWRDAPEKKITLVTEGALLSEFSARAGAAARAACNRLGVAVQENMRVEQIEPTRLRLSDNKQLETQITILATGAAPPELLGKIKVQLADDGYVAVNSGLQSRSHKNVFAAGDCATNPKLDVPKSLVYAVRQGPLLAGNLMAMMRGKSLESYVHDEKARSLISLGDKRAIAAQNGWSVSGSWLWHWKNRLDRKWIERYSFDGEKR
ncbi:MAG: hypothetical protein EAZ43_11235 [Betaproteobacteria bacterium]|nr:MAG: hypothetical protein EAZ43_11235 [Betaproteobacteria bacterium]